MTDYKNLKLIATSNPHIRGSETTQTIMRDVIIAMCPALIWSIVIFGVEALVLTAISAAGCVFFEWLYRFLMKKPQSIGDLSAVVTGILLAFVCPVTLSYGILIIGDFFAIVIVKQLFGGLGTNFLNPALAGRAFMMLCYPVPMTTWVLPGKEYWASVGSAADAVTGATPLSVDFMKSGLLPQIGNADLGYEPATLADMFIGNVGGCIGEVSAIALLIGGIYLIVRGVIRIRIPVAYIATVAVLTLVFSRGDGNAFQWMLFEIFGGGLFLGAFFMATDYVTSPCTPKGEIIYGVGCGLLTVFIRYFGGFPEGVSYAILVMNLFVPIIEKYTHPSRFGLTKAAAKAAKAAAKKGGAEV